MASDSPEQQWIEKQCPLLYRLFSSHGKWSTKKLAHFCQRHQIPYDPNNISSSCQHVWSWIMKQNHERLVQTNKNQQVDTIPIIEAWMKEMNQENMNEFQTLFTLKEIDPHMFYIQQKKPVAQLIKYHIQDKACMGWILMNFLQVDHRKKYPFDLSLYFTRIYQIYKYIALQQIFVLSETFDMSLSEYIQLHSHLLQCEDKKYPSSKSKLIWTQLKTMIQHLMAGLYLLDQMGYSLPHQAIMAQDSVGLVYKPNTKTWQVKWRHVHMIQAVHHEHKDQSIEIFIKYIQQLIPQCSSSSSINHPLYPVSQVIYQEHQYTSWNDIFTFLNKHV